MSNVYLSDLSQVFIHTMTDFLCQRSFYISQTDIVSLQKVSQYVFSDVEDWLNCFNSVSGTEQSESDLAEQDFLSGTSCSETSHADPTLYPISQELSSEHLYSWLHWP